MNLPLPLAGEKLKIRKGSQLTQWRGLLANKALRAVSVPTNSEVRNGELGGPAENPSVNRHFNNGKKGGRSCRDRFV